MNTLLEIRAAYEGLDWQTLTITEKGNGSVVVVIQTKHPHRAELRIHRYFKIAGKWECSVDQIYSLQ